MKEERKTVCCLNDNVRIDPRRRTGNTTRLVNEAINIIFEGHICLVKDHCDTRDTNSELFDKIIDRLWSEHSTLLEDGLIENDEKALTINLKQ